MDEPTEAQLLALVALLDCARADPGLAQVAGHGPGRTRSRPATTRAAVRSASATRPAVPVAGAAGGRAAATGRGGSGRIPVKSRDDLPRLRTGRTALAGRLEDNLFRGQSRDIGTKIRVRRPGYSGRPVGRAGHDETARRAFCCTPISCVPATSSTDRLRRRTAPATAAAQCRVSAIQHGKVIFFCAALPGSRGRREHQLSMPEAAPEDLEPAPAMPPLSLAGPADQIATLAGPAGAVRVPPRVSTRRLHPPSARPTNGSGFRLSSSPVGDAMPSSHRALLPTPATSTCSAPATFPHGISYYQPNVAMASARPCPVVPSPLPRRRMAAVQPRQPERAGRAGWPAAWSSTVPAGWWPAPRRKV